MQAARLRRGARARRRRRRASGMALRWSVDAACTVVATRVARAVVARGRRLRRRCSACSTSPAARAWSSAAAKARRMLLDGELHYGALALAGHRAGQARGHELVAGGRIPRRARVPVGVRGRGRQPVRGRGVPADRRAGRPARRDRRPAGGDDQPGRRGRSCCSRCCPPSCCRSGLAGAAGALAGKAVIKRAANVPALVFEIRTSDPGSYARTGTLKLAHGEVRTPAFVPLATKAVVKTLEVREAADARLRHGAREHVPPVPDARPRADRASSAACTSSSAGTARSSPTPAASRSSRWATGRSPTRSRAAPRSSPASAPARSSRSRRRA